MVLSNKGHDNYNDAKWHQSEPAVVETSEISRVAEVATALSAQHQEKSHTWYYEMFEKYNKSVQFDKLSLSKKFETAFLPEFGKKRIMVLY
jgi:hypothetical protein